MIRLSHFFKALHELGISEVSIGRCFGDFQKGSVSEWINEKKRTSIKQQDLLIGTEKCRRFIGLDEHEFVIRLIDNLDSSQITIGEKNRLRERYAQLGSYTAFLKYLIQEAHRNSYSRAKPVAIVYDPISTVRHTVAIGIEHIVGVREDGRVLYTGANDFGQCDVQTWRNVVSVSCGWRKTVGLRSDGTCVEVGNNPSPNLELFQWRDIIAVEAGPFHVLGLRKDGAVLAFGRDQYGQCQLGDWHSIASIAAGTSHSVGLKRDGTVVARGSNQYGQCELSAWRDIVQIAAAGDHTVGLTRDGKVLIAGDACEFLGSSALDWTDITSVATGSFHVTGLRRDHTVVAAGFKGDNQCAVGEWQNIVAIFAGYNTSAAIREDGRVLSTRGDYARSIGHTETSDWRLFNDTGTVRADDSDVLLRQLREHLQNAKELTLNYVVSCQKIQLQMDLEEPFDDYEANRLLQELVENTEALSEFRNRPGISPLFAERAAACVEAFQKYYGSVEPGIGKLAKSMGRYLSLAENELLVDYLTLVRTTIQELNQRLGNGPLSSGSGKGSD